MSLCRLHLLLVFVFVNNPLLDRTYELNYSIAVCLWQVIELESRIVCLTIFAVCVPHNSLYLVSSTCIV